MLQGRMSTPVAIILGAIIVALGVAGGLIGARSVPRYQLLSAGQNVLRLNTRTGEVADCTTYRTADPAMPNGDLALSLWKCESLIYPRVSR